MLCRAAKQKQQTEALDPEKPDPGTLRVLLMTSYRLAPSDIYMADK